MSRGVEVKLSIDELAALDQLAGKGYRAEYLRQLLRDAAANKEITLAYLTTPRGEYDRALRRRLADVFISVANVRVQVAHIVDGKTTPATNWESLEDEAIGEIELQGGFPSMSGIYDCPFRLAQKAQWE